MGKFQRRVSEPKIRVAKRRNSCQGLSSGLLLLCNFKQTIEVLIGGVRAAMDNTALQDLISQVRGSVASLAEAEQKVAALKNEFAQQERPKPAPLRKVEPMPTRVNSGWQFVA